MKTLKPGPRPFIALGGICILLYMMPLYVGVCQGKWNDAGKMAACMLFLPALLLGPIAFARLEVDQEEIRLVNFGLVRKKVRYEDIGYSWTQVLAEKDWPVSLTIAGPDIDSSNADEDSQVCELMTVGLKIFKKDDVKWLISLPQLKVRSSHK